MPNASHAILQQRDGRTALLFERVLSHPPAQVWQALTTYDGLHQWHPTPFQLDDQSPVPGATIKFVSSAESPVMPDGRLLEYNPPHLLAHTWGNDQLRWELEAHDDGCLLRLTHIFDDHFKAARDASGWHLCLGALSRALDRDPEPQRGVEPGLPQGWSELNREYEQRFGIDPEQATPPPPRGGS